MGGLNDPDKGDNVVVSGPKVINSMFGMEMDSDSESESGNENEDQIKVVQIEEELEWKPGPPSMTRIKRCDRKNRKLEERKKRKRTIRESADISDSNKRRTNMMVIGTQEMENERERNMGDGLLWKETVEIFEKRLDLAVAMKEE